jgi:hypothetical protein
MRKLTLIALAAGMLASPVLADDAMKSSSMMSTDAMGAMSSEPMAMGSDNMMMTTTKAGEVMAIMPGGQMGTAMMEGDKMTMTIGMSAAIDHCVMFITGADGKVYQVDTSSAAAQAECEGIAK